MASPMPDIPEHVWCEVDAAFTRETCPLTLDPHIPAECGVIYYVDAEGRWVKDCTMAGISADCSWH